MKDLREYIEKLHDNVDIVEVISKYVKLKKQGRNYVGLCPFHEEKTPSFVVSPEKQIFHCFGCGASGDVIKFIMRIEDVDFKTAVREIAKEAGLPAPQFTAQATVYKEENKDELLKVMNLVGEFFRSQLNDGVISYLENRGVTKDSIKKFKLGFAPDSGNKLLDFAKQNKINISLLEKVGLVKKDSNGQIRSYFWNRVIIPIFDLRNNIIAFGGRIFGNGEPKYLNSPDTVLFTKGELLYPINFAKDGIRSLKSAIVVEGYFDALILQQEGIINAVSSMGTSFTEAQARLIKRYADTVYFLYDDDAAGAKGAERAIEIGSKKGLVVKIGVPFGGLDPDEIVLKYGKEKLLEIINDAKDPLQFIASVELKTEGNTPQGRARVMQRMLETVSNIADKTEAYEYLKEISKIFSVDMSFLVDQYNAVKLKMRYRNRKTRKESLPSIDKVIEAERLLVQAVIQRPEVLQLIEDKLDIEEIFDPEFKDIFLSAKQDIENGKVPDPKNWINLTDKEAQIADELALRDSALVNDFAIKQTIENLNKDILYRARAANLFREYEETGDLSKLKEYNEILRKLKGR
jgi:DNA primase